MLRSLGLGSNDEEEEWDEEAEDYEEEDDGSEGEPEEKGKGTAAALKSMFSNPIVVLLLFVPVAWILDFVDKGMCAGKPEVDAAGKPCGIQPIFKFFANFFSIIPLAWMISESTEHLEKVTGPMLGILLNMSFANIVEIILGITLISKGYIKMVQNQLMGAMLMNISLVLGLCFLAAGMKSHRQKFNKAQATYNVGLLSIAALGMSVPTGLAVFDEWGDETDRLKLSRWVATLLFLGYLQWLGFNLCTHVSLFDSRKKGEIHWFWAIGPDDKKKKKSNNYDSLDSDDDGPQNQNDDDDEDEASIHWTVACTLLAIASVLVAFHCDWLVDSILPLCKEYGVKMAFISTVLLPMVGNFSEVIAAVSIAMKGKIDLAMGVAIGSATQIALCVIPVSVFIAYCFDKPMDLDFEIFQVKLLLTTLLVCAILLMDGEANWLKGSLLVTAYVIMASAFWIVTDREFESAGVPPGIISVNQTGVDQAAITKD